MFGTDIDKEMMLPEKDDILKGIGMLTVLRILLKIII